MFLSLLKCIVITLTISREEQTGPGQLDCKAFLLCPEHAFFLLMVCQESECFLMYGVICRIGSQLSHYRFWQTLIQTDRAVRGKSSSTEIKEEPLQYVYCTLWAEHLTVLKHSLLPFPSWEMLKGCKTSPNYILNVLFNYTGLTAWPP